MQCPVTAGLSLCLIPGRGDGSPPRSSPGSSIGVLGRFDSGDLVMTPAVPRRVLGSVTPDALPSHQHHCNVHKWWSFDIRYSVGRPPTMENGPCVVEPPWRTDLWSSRVASNGVDAPCRQILSGHACVYRCHSKYRLHATLWWQWRVGWQRVCKCHCWLGNQPVMSCFGKI